MPPKTSARGAPPARVTGWSLGERMRRWRRQPRQASPGLFWGLLGLALLLDAAALAQGTYLLRRTPVGDLAAVLLAPLRAAWPAAPPGLRGLPRTVPAAIALAGEGAFAAAWALGNFNLLLVLLAPHYPRLVRAVAGLCRRALAAGVLLLGAGLLPGCWRGWAGAEQWELLVLACYGILLAARVRGAVGDFGLSAWAVACFALVLLAPEAGGGPGESRGAWLCGGVLLDGCLAAHAALRYWCGRHRAAA